MKRLITLSIFIACTATAIWIALSDSVDDQMFKSADRFLEIGLKEHSSNEKSASAKAVNGKAAKSQNKIKAPEASAGNRLALDVRMTKDFHYLEKNNFLGFKKNDLRDVQVLIDPQLKDQEGLQKIVNLIYSAFPKSEKGKKKLEITIIGGNDTNADTVNASENAESDSNAPSEKRLLVLQFSLTDAVSQNKIWEMGRTYSY